MCEIFELKCLRRFRSFLCLYLDVFTANTTALTLTTHHTTLMRSMFSTSCKRVTLNCAASWKSGIPQGRETAIPSTYKKFLTCHESSSLCGYVSIDPKSGEDLAQRGATIGTGVDLGHKSFSSLPSDLVAQLRPYDGLKGNLAACATIERPLTLTLG